MLYSCDGHTHAKVGRRSDQSVERRASRENGSVKIGRALRRDATWLASFVFSFFRFLSSSSVSSSPAFRHRVYLRRGLLCTADLPLVPSNSRSLRPRGPSLFLSSYPLHSTRHTSLPRALVPALSHTPAENRLLRHAFFHPHLARPLVTRALGRRLARTLLRSPGRDPQAGRVHRTRGSETRQPRAEKVVVEQEEACFPQVVALIVVVQVVGLVVLLRLARQQ